MSGTDPLRTSIPTTANKNADIEFVDFHGLRRLFGIPRSTAYELIDAGEIRSVSLRKKGRQKGRRLIDCDSVRAMFARFAVGEGRASGHDQAIQESGESE